MTPKHKTSQLPTLNNEPTLKTIKSFSISTHFIIGNSIAMWGREHLCCNTKQVFKPQLQCCKCTKKKKKLKFWLHKKNVNKKQHKLKMKAKTYKLKSKFESFSKKFCSSINLVCFSIVVESFSRNSTMILSFKGPSHPTQPSLGQFLMMRMSQSKFSILSLDHLKIHYILICDPKPPSIWQNCTSCFSHQIKRFSIFVGHIINHRYNCNSFFNVDIIVSSFEIIYPKNRSSSSTIVSWFVLP